MKAPTTNKITVLRESHETSETVARRLELAGGRNRFGEPNYRVIWGWNRLAWIGGKFEDRDEHGTLLRERIELRREPKYPAVNRWHIERWVPPEMYGSPRAWYAQTNEIANGRTVAALGPYPSRGEYEHCFQLTPTVAEYVATAIERARCKSRGRSREKLYDREAREDRAYENWAFDLLDDQVRAFHKQPFVTVSQDHPSFDRWERL